jgi:RNA polymerase-associated protein RTF1
MDMSSGEEEDGQVTKQDEAEARERRLLEQTRPDKDRDPLTLADLMPCWLDRVQVAKFYMTPWFEEYVQGARRTERTACCR